MRTNIDTDDQLLDRAMKMAGRATKQDEVVVGALMLREVPQGCTPPGQNLLSNRTCTLVSSNCGAWSYRIAPDRVIAGVS